jgi:hypothetical protein
MLSLLHWRSWVTSRCHNDAGSMANVALRWEGVGFITILLLLSASGCMVPHPHIIPETMSPETARILDNYVRATEAHEDALRGTSMEVSIDASIPKLKEHATLRALRRISKLGQITYRVLGFQGSSTVKNQVIARYLQAEQQGQGDQSLAITPANYKFKFKGQETEPNHQQVYVFNISPRKKRVGLFKGQIWIDAQTYLPVLEKGRFVKNPSIFFKRVDFERAFKIQNGIAVPEYLNSVIDARLIGKVELNISYSNLELEGSNQAGSSALTPQGTTSVTVMTISQQRP